MGAFFHFRRAAFSSMLKSRVSSILAKAAALRINLNLDGAPITSKSHTHPSSLAACAGAAPAALVQRLQSLPRRHPGPEPATAELLDVSGSEDSPSPYQQA